MSDSYPNLSVNDFVWSRKGNGFTTSINEDKITIKLPDTSEERIISRSDINGVAYKAKKDED